MLTGNRMRLAADGGVILRNDLAVFRGDKFRRNHFFFPRTKFRVVWLITIKLGQFKSPQ